MDDNREETAGQEAAQRIVNALRTHRDLIATQVERYAEADSLTEAALAAAFGLLQANGTLPARALTREEEVEFMDAFLELRDRRGLPGTDIDNLVADLTAFLAEVWHIVNMRKRDRQRTEPVQTPPYDAGEAALQEDMPQPQRGAPFTNANAWAGEQFSAGKLPRDIIGEYTTRYEDEDAHRSSARATLPDKALRDLYGRWKEPKKTKKTKNG